MDDSAVLVVSRRRRRRLLLAALLAAAAALRLWGLRQGYPQLYGHVDEIGVAASVWNFFRAATLMPTEFTYPAFYSYCVALGLWVSGCLGLSPFRACGAEALTLLSHVEPGWVVLVGRAISVAADVATVLLTWRLGRRACDPRVAAVAACFVAVATVPIAQAHRALPDSLMALLATVSFLFSWRIYESGRWRDYLGAGMAAGLVVSTKYNGALVAFAPVAAHALRHGWTMPWRWLARPQLVAAVAVAVAALFAGSPYLLLTPERYLAVARYQVSSLGFALGDTAPWWWVARDLMKQELLIGVLMLGGVVRAALRRDPLSAMLLAVVVPSWAYIGSWTRESLHYLLHLYPLLALAAARLLVAVLDGAVSPTRRRALTWVVAAVAAAPSVARTIDSDRALSRTDTRALAAAWVQRHVLDGSRVAMTWYPYCPQLALAPSRRSLSEQYVDDPVAMDRLRRSWGGGPAYELINLEAWRREPVVPEGLRERIDLDDPETRRVFSRGWRSPEQLRRLGVQWIILPEAAYRRYLETDGPEPRGAAARYHLLKNRAYFSRLTAPGNPRLELVASFVPGPNTRGDAIHVLRLRPGPLRE